ncbi:hypothetical protein [Maribacter sp. Asnod2-G09]|uniref:hypothetical protein n=1 Tax=Maribacter sp. Asnod2-G09 TaxID=3160577 RepID=UPI003862FF77
MLDKTTIKKALKLCVNSLNSEENRIQNAKEVTLTIRQLYKEPYQGKGLGIGDLSWRNFRAKWEDYRIRWEDSEKIQTGLDWKTAFLLLGDAMNVSEVEIFNIAKNIEEDILFNHVLKHIITNCVVQNEIEQALSYISHFRETHIFEHSDNQDLGYLIILKHYATKGDKYNFFKYFKLAKPAKNRTEVADCKDWLVTCFSENNSLNDAIKLCTHRNLGKKFYQSALKPFAEKGMYQELKKIFVNQPELKQPELNTEIKIYIESYLNAVKNSQKIDDDFEWLFSQCLKIDRKIRFGDVKLQDAMLLDLGIASEKQDYKERALKCRKAIKDNRMKRELVLK